MPFTLLASKNAPTRLTQCGRSGKQSRNALGYQQPRMLGASKPACQCEAGGGVGDVWQSCFCVLDLVQRSIGIGGQFPLLVQACLTSRPTGRGRDGPVHRCPCDAKPQSGGEGYEARAAAAYAVEERGLRPRPKLGLFVQAERRHWIWEDKGVPGPREVADGELGLLLA